MARLLQPPPMECECSFLISSVRSARKIIIKISKIVLERKAHPLTQGSTCSALASWASKSVPIGVATIQPFSTFLCVILSLSLSYLVLRVLVSACCHEELHNGGVTVARGPNESSVAILHMRKENGLSERQKRGTRVPARQAWRVCGEWELARS